MNLRFWFRPWTPGEFSEQDFCWQSFPLIPSAWWEPGNVPFTAWNLSWNGGAVPSPACLTLSLVRGARKLPGFLWRNMKFQNDLEGTLKPIQPGLGLFHEHELRSFFLSQILLQTDFGMIQKEPEFPVPDPPQDPFWPSERFWVNKPMREALTFDKDTNPIEAERFLWSLGWFFLSLKWDLPSPDLWLSCLTFVTTWPCPTTSARGGGGENTPGCAPSPSSAPLCCS